MTTSDPVEIEGELIRLVGRGMLVDMEAKTFKVLSQVKTQWRGGKKG
jgi:lipopolysaccharide export system protein LptC